MLPLKAHPQQATIVWLCIVLFLSASIPGWTQQADFSFVQSSNCSPQTVTFKSLATGNLTSWKWDMGNGNVFNNSTAADVSVVYTAAGTYTVTLTVSNSTASHSISKNVVVHTNPKAAFDIDLPASECAPREIEFVNQSTDKPDRELSYRWVFGDGGSSEDENPVHTYTNPGSYSVTLTVTNDMGCDTTIVKTEVITVQGLDPEFSTNAQGSLCSAPASIEFSSTGDDAASYEWDFGDGSTGQGKKIIHVYSTTGTFTASLTIADADGCSSTITENIFIGSEAGADFTVTSDKVCIGDGISFTPILDGVVETLLWDFGDESTSQETNPVKQYPQADTYTVTLIVKLLGKECESIISKQVQVVADAVPTFEYKTNCSGLATFTNESTNSASWLWDFGDGQTSTAKIAPACVW